MFTRSFFDYAPIGKQKLFSEHPVRQRLSSFSATCKAVERLTIYGTAEARPFV
jgi:hypothetical protein